MGIPDNAEITALLTARRLLHAKMWDLYHTGRPKNQKKLITAAAPLQAQLHDNGIALRAAIVEHVWREHPDWRRARVMDQHQVMDLAESIFTELIGNVDLAPVEGNVASTVVPKSKTK